MRHYSEDDFEELESEIFFCLENIRAPECTLAEAGRFYEEAQEALRAHAILRILIDADRKGFSTDLVLSGYARRAYLRRCAKQRYADHFLATSRSGALLDALAADAPDLAGELLQLSPADWRKGDEYEADFCYHGLLGLLATDAPEAKLDALLARFEKAVDGKGARLAVCRALRNGKPAAFKTAFADLLRLRKKEVAEDDLAEESVAAALEARVFVEGIAVLKVARRRGLRIERHYPGCPAVTLKPAKRATPDDEFAQFPEPADRGGKARRPKPKPARPPKTEYVVWKSFPLGNACVLEGVENVEKTSGLARGVPFAARFPANAVMRMSDRHRKDTGLVDDVSSFSLLKVCSPRIVDFLKKKQLENVEFLPIKILDHKGKVASKDYCIVHPIHLQDALDHEKSRPVSCDIIPGEIDDVARLVLDATRLAPEVRIFRLKGYFKPVLVEKSLADELAGLGLRGPEFIPLREYEK